MRKIGSSTVANVSSAASAVSNPSTASNIGSSSGGASRSAGGLSSDSSGSVSGGAGGGGGVVGESAEQGKTMTAIIPSDQNDPQSRQRPFDMRNRLGNVEDTLYTDLTRQIAAAEPDSDGDSDDDNDALDVDEAALWGVSIVALSRVHDAVFSNVGKRAGTRQLPGGGKTHPLTHLLTHSLTHSPTD